MKGKKILVLLLVLLLTATLFACGNNSSNEGGDTPDPQENVWPAEGSQIRLVITHGQGGSVDTAARGMAPFLEKYLGVPVYCENMEGASGRKAMKYVYEAEPDGYTIVVSAHPSRLIGEMMYPDEAGYSMRDFTKLGSWTKGDVRAIIAKAGGDYDTLEKILKAGEEKKLKCAGGGGVGSTSQLQQVYLQDVVGINTDFIPYDSTAEVLNAVLNGEVQFGLQPLSSALRSSADGNVCIVAIHAEERSDRCPDVPTLKELGYEGVVIENMDCAYAPPGTPDYIVEAYAEAIKKAFDDPEFLAWAEANNIFLHYSTPEEVQADTEQAYLDIETVLPRLMEDIK